MSPAIKDQNPSASSVVTAAQIAEGELGDLGKRIAARLEKVRGYEAKARDKAGVELRKADDHWNTLTRELAEAKAKCDGGGFKAFKKKYCPNLSRARIYKLIAIGAGKKTLAESRAEVRKSVAQSRRKKASPTSPVGDKSEQPVKQPVEQPPEDNDGKQARVAYYAARENDGKVEEKLPEEKVEGKVEEKSPEEPIAGAEAGLVTSPNELSNPPDVLLDDFTLQIRRLQRVIEGQKPERFAGTPVSGPELREFARFLWANPRAKADFVPADSGIPEDPKRSAA